MATLESRLNLWSSYFLCRFAWKHYVNTLWDNSRIRDQSDAGQALIIGEAIGVAMNKRQGLFLRIYSLIILLLLYLPIGVLVLLSLTDGVVFAFPVKGLTTHWYRYVLGNAALLAALRNSAVVAVGSSLVAT